MSDSTWGTATKDIDVPMPEVILERASDMMPEPISWLWPGWLASGKYTLLAGAPGTGKTTAAMALAATVTIGGRWPDGSRSPAGNVAIWSGEDDPRDTLRPRLSAAGADPNRVFFISGVNDGDGPRAFDPAHDVEPLAAKLAEIGDVRLLIIDPIVSAVTGDGNSNPQVRRNLQQLVDLAASMRCALLGISHFRKGSTGGDPVERVNGSIAFVALARVAIAAAVKHEEDGRATRIFVRTKSNIGPDDGGFEYSLLQTELHDHPGVFASYTAWGDAIQGTARELLASAEEQIDSDGGTLDEVARWLRDLLGEEGGSIDRRDVMRAAQAMGYKERTVHRARDRLGLDVKMMGFGKDKRSIWTWGADPIPAKDAQSCQPETLAQMGMIGTNGTDGGDVEVIV